MVHFTFVFAGYFLIAAVLIQSRNVNDEKSSVESRTTQNVEQVRYFVKTTPNCCTCKCSHCETRKEPLVQLPGRNKTFGQQCRDKNPRYYSGVCAVNNHAKQCEQLVCADTGESDLPNAVLTGPALDGTTCGKNKICLKGYCVQDDNPSAELSITEDFQYDCGNVDNSVSLPGRYKSFGEQCQDFGYSGICSIKKLEKQCTNIICADTHTSDIVLARPILGMALNGTMCGRNKICLRGMCVIDDNPPPKNFKTTIDIPHICWDGYTLLDKQGNIETRLYNMHHD